MCRPIGFLLFTILLASWPLGSQARSAVSRAPTPGAPAAASAEAPCRPEIGYYIVASARLTAPDSVYVLGASNLPAGSVLTIYIYNFIGEGSQMFGGRDRAAVVGSRGLFSVELRPKPGLAFRSNLLCDVVFEADPHDEPSAIIRAVGRRGERLGTLGTNPEVELNSGGQYLDELVAVRG
jgi:hypothetical protein